MTSTIRSKNLLEIRNFSRAEFIERHASGTLRKASRSGLDCDEHYLHERLAFEFGFTFDSINSENIKLRKGISLPDTSAVTETLWLFDRYVAMHVFEEDTFELNYIEFVDSPKQGLGIVLKKTNVDWIPENRTVYALIAEYDCKTNHWKDAVNPC